MGNKVEENTLIERIIKRKKVMSVGWHESIVADGLGDYHCWFKVVVEEVLTPRSYKGHYSM